MNSVKPEIDQRTIELLLSEHFDQTILDINPVQGGLIAQTLSFRAGGKEYILRFSTDKMEASYQKEAYIYRNFSAPGIPIPPVLQAGSLGEYNYCISRKMPGTGLEFLPEEEYRQALPEVIHTLYIIHQVNVQGREGFGCLDDRGKWLRGAERFLC
jgi:hygromycin-B 4-O-kinase